MMGALVAHFITDETGVALGDTELCLVGELHSGLAFSGGDAISTVACGLGPELALLLPALAWAGRADELTRAGIRRWTFRHSLWGQGRLAARDE